MPSTYAYFFLTQSQLVETGDTVTTVQSSVVDVKTLLPVTSSVVPVMLVTETFTPRCAKVISLRMTPHASE